MTAAEVIARATARGVRIATAESCTGGMIAAALTDVAGASAVFEAGFVTYSNAAKTAMLGVDPDVLARFGAVSEQTARAMAEGARARAGADVAVSVTGIAGPGGATPGKPVGRVCFALARGDAPTATRTVDFGNLGRDRVRRAAVAQALDLIAAALGD